MSCQAGKVEEYQMTHANIKIVKFIYIYVIILVVQLLALQSCSSGEQSGNRFYNKNIKNCISCGRRFTVNQNGAEILNKPDGKTLARTDAGKILEVICYYTDGNGDVWGYIISPAEGWISMSEASLVYDNIAFFDEHSEQITDPQGNILPDGPRYLWSYPCSGVIIGTDSSPEEEINITAQYADAEGRVWVYFDGSGWICLDAPYDKNIPAVDYGEAHMTYELPYKEPGYWDTAPSYAPFVWAAIVLIFIIEAVSQVRAYIRNNKK